VQFLDGLVVEVMALGAQAVEALFPVMEFGGEGMGSVLGLG
jgi:hypothetical protein